MVLQHCNWRFQNGLGLLQAAMQQKRPAPKGCKPFALEEHLFLSLVEGHLDGDGLEEFLADLDVYLGAGLGVLGLDEGGADVLAGAGAGLPERTSPMSLLCETPSWQFPRIPFVATKEASDQALPSFFEACQNPRTTDPMPSDIWRRTYSTACRWSGIRQK